MKFTTPTLKGMMRNRHEPESLHLMADYYWRTLLVMSISGAIAVVAYNIWVYADVTSSLSTKTEMAPPPEAKPPFDPKALGAIAQQLASRREQFQSLSASVPAAPDPSAAPLSPKLSPSEKTKK